MSTDWKKIGKNSGNMRQYRNVTHNKLNYETGKFNSIYDISGIPTKGYTFDICGENIVLGVGTDKPFSRLSMGNNTNSGEFNATEPGQLAAIALDESGTGHGFTGIVLNSNIKTLDDSQTKGLQIMSSKSDFSMNDICGGRIILSNDNVTTIGGNSRKKPYGYNTSTTVTSNPSINIVLDVRGSIRTDGYINFFDSPESGSATPAGELWRVQVGNIPTGSLFLSEGDNYGPEGLYFKNRDGKIASVATGATIENFFSGNRGAFDISANNDTDYFIASQGSTTGTNGGVPVTINGKVWSPYQQNNDNSFKNALTIRDGNLAVITPIGEQLKVTNPPSFPTDYGGGVQSPSSTTYFTDQSGGIILAQKQLLIGKTENNTTTHDRFGYGLIDIQTVHTVPSIVSTDCSNNLFKPTAATNSIILLTSATTTLGFVGNIYDCSNTIIIGSQDFDNINTPNSLISISETGGQIIDISGSNLVFGKNNDLSGSPFSIMFGSNNTIDNSNKTGDSPEGKENVVLGTNNELYNSQNSFVDGSGNINYGNLNVIFGNNNNLGSASNKLGSNCFIQGNSNTITAFPDISVNNAFIAGYKNQLHCDYTSFVKDTEDSHILLGSKANISYHLDSDSSNVRFAFGTKAMEGNVFTIDISGNVEISGNLLVKGERTEFRTEFLDVSDNNLSLNYPGTNTPEGGGITLRANTGGHKGLKWTEDGPYSSDNCWDTSGSDISTNNLYANNIIANDISCVDISCVDISAVNGYFTGDLSCNGKLTVGGVIDPTALLFTTVTGTTTGLGSSPSGGAIWSNGDKLYFVPSGENPESKSEEIFTDSGNSGSMTSWKIGNGSTTSNVAEGQTANIKGGDGITSTRSIRDITLAVDLATSGAGVGGLQIDGSNKLQVKFGTSDGTVLEGSTSLFDGDYGSLTNLPNTFVVTNSNWTAAGKTCADLGTVTTAVINGGSINGTTIGASTKAAGSFTAVTIDPNAAGGGGLIISNTTTQNANELVKITGESGQTALNIVAGTSQFAEAVTMSAGLSLNQGTSNVITIDDNKASSLVIKSSGTNANFFTIDTTTNAEKVKLTGAAVGTDVFHVDVGTSQFDEGVTMSGGLSLNHATLNKITLIDNQATALQIGSTDALDLLTLKTTNGTEAMIVKGTTAKTAFHVDVGTSQFDEDVGLLADLSMNTDGSKISFGANGEITLTHEHNKGLILKNELTTSSNGTVHLTLQNNETAIVDGDELGIINFQAPNENSGTDAIVIAASIAAVAEGTFAAANNATELSFRTAAAGAPTEKMSLSSTGVVTISATVASTNKDSGALVISNGGAGIEGNLYVGGTLTAGSIVTTQVNIPLAVISAAPADSTELTVNKCYVMSNLSANRTYKIPDPTAIGEQIKIVYSTKHGDGTVGQDLIFQTKTAGTLLNGYARIHMDTQSYESAVLVPDGANDNEINTGNNGDGRTGTIILTCTSITDDGIWYVEADITTAAAFDPAAITFFATQQ